MLMGLKNAMKKSRARNRKAGRTPGQVAKDARVWACSRKVLHATEAEAKAVAERMNQTVYKCSYGDHFHCAHLPGSRRFVRGVSV